MLKHCKKLWILSVLVAALLYPGFVTAHGNVSLESDICVRNMAGSMVHLSTYQPQHNPQAEYCTEIPHEGETFWVLDLIDHALRNMPIDIKIVRGSGDTLSDTVANIYSTDHADGIIKGRFDLDKGQYTLHVTGLGVPALHYEYPLQIQSGNATNTIMVATYYLIAFLLVVLFCNKYLRWRQAQH